MSYKLQRGDEEPAAEPMAWRMVGEGQTGGVFVAGSAYGTETERAEQRLREAHEAGRREGEEAGRSRAAAEMQPALERIGRSIAEMGALRARLRREAEQDLIRLALAIARRILRRELVVDPDALRGLVLSALEKLQAQEISRVRVHPAQAALVTECVRQATSGPAVEMVGAPGCEPGTVVFETERGSLDASVESQLREIERGLTDRLRKHP